MVRTTAQELREELNKISCNVWVPCKVTYEWKSQRFQRSLWSYKVIECLLKQKAFIVKKVSASHPAESQKLGQVTWSKFGGASMAWQEAVRRSGFWNSLKAYWYVKDGFDSGVLNVKLLRIGDCVDLLKLVSWSLPYALSKKLGVYS